MVHVVLFGMPQLGLPLFWLLPQPLALAVYAPQGGLYVEQVQNRFRGALDLKALRTAWERVQERHAILRSSFRWEGLRRPLQVVAEQSSLRWHEEDWRGSRFLRCGRIRWPRDQTNRLK